MKPEAKTKAAKERLANLLDGAVLSAIDLSNAVQFRAALRNPSTRGPCLEALAREWTPCLYKRYPPGVS